MKSFVYLASPYSHADERVMFSRFEAACQAAAKLMLAGETVFSPIAHSHPVCVHIAGVQTDFEFWMKQDLPILRCAEKLLVLMLPGWEQSRGVTEEIRVAKTEGIPVEYIDL